MTVPYIYAHRLHPPGRGVLVALIPKENVKAIKWTALIVSFFPLVLSAIVWFTYAPETVRRHGFEELYEWIPALGVSYPRRRRRPQHPADLPDRSAHVASRFSIPSSSTSGPRSILPSSFCSKWA